MLEGTGEENTTTAVEDSPSIIDTIRSEYQAEDSEPTSAAADPNTTSTPAEGAVTQQQTEAAQTLRSEGNLSEAQIAELINRPEIVQAVLGTDYARSALDEIIDNAFSERDNQKVVEQEQAKVRATLEEAWKKGEEQGDWSEYGQIMADHARKTSELESLRPEIEQEVVDQLDGAFTAAFQAEIGQLTESEQNALSRELYRSDGEWLQAVMGAVRAKAYDLARQGLSFELNQAQLASKNNATAARARGDSLPALPGGSTQKGIASTDASIGSLMREGLKDAFGESD